MYPPLASSFILHHNGLSLKTVLSLSVVKYGPPTKQGFCPSVRYVYIRGWWLSPQQERVIITNKFFHLPSLYVYILAVVLLVTSVFHAAALLRQGLYVVLGLNETNMPYNYNSDLITLTPAAQEYLESLANERTRQTDIANFVRSSVMLIVSLGFFYFFWQRGDKSLDLEMAFSVRNFYFFLVSSLAFLIFFFTLSSGINNLVQSTVVGDRLYYYDMYKPYTAPVRPDEQQEKRIVDIDEVKENLALQQKEYSSQWKHSQKRQVVDQLTIALVAFPLFFIHDRKFSF